MHHAIKPMILSEKIHQPEDDHSQKDMLQDALHLEEGLYAENVLQQKPEPQKVTGQKITQQNTEPQKTVLQKPAVYPKQDLHQKSIVTLNTTVYQKDMLQDALHLEEGLYAENVLQQKPEPQKVTGQKPEYQKTVCQKIASQKPAYQKINQQKTTQQKPEDQKPVTCSESTVAPKKEHRKNKREQKSIIRQKTVVRRIRVAELFSNEHCLALHDEYMHESALAKLPAPEEKMASYTALEASGSDVFSLYGAFVGDELVGFLILLTPVIPHYGTAIAVAESLFVAAKHRSSGAGLLLIRKAEQRAKEMGSQGILFSSPTGGRLSVLLPRIGYRETNHVFFKENL